MIHIKKFIDKVSLMETKQSKDLIMPMQDARGLRDELAKMLADFHSKAKDQKNDIDEIKIEIKGGSFR